MPEQPRRAKILKAVLEGAGLLVVLIVLMLWLAGAFTGKVKPGPPAPLGPAPGVVTAAVEERKFPLLIQQVGTTRMETEAQVSSRIMAQVREVLVREGESVAGPDGKGGTVIARLDDRDAQAKLLQAASQVTATSRAIESAKARLGSAAAQLEAAKAHLVQADADYTRYQNLLKEGVTTGQQVEHMRAEKDIAAAQVRAATLDVDAAQGDLARFEAQKQEADAAATQARVSLSYTVIEAPFTGRVVRKLVDVGDTVNPGQGLFTIETPSRPQLHAWVVESLLPFLRMGQKLDVSVDTLNRTFAGTVADIIPKVDPATRTVLVKIALPPDPALVSGLFGRVLIPHGEYSTLVIPAACVREVGQLDLVDALDSAGHPHRRFVTLGDRHGALVEVLSGLKAGERVVQP